jgi:hypothetical protein
MAKLKNINEICKYINRELDTAIQWHVQYDMPMKKDTKTHSYVADTKEIDAWLECIRKGEPYKPNKKRTKTSR